MSFDAWFAQNGGICSPAMRLHQFSAANGGRGAIALRDIAEEEELCWIPRKLVLTVETSSLPALLGPEDWRKVSEGAGWTGLILAMAYEHLQGMRWTPYLNELPTSFDSLIWWSTNELAELQGSTILEKLGRDEAETMWAERIAPMVHSRPDVFGADPSIYSVELLHRMGSNILSRSFHARHTDDSDDEDEDDASDVAMIPWADFLNARSGSSNARLYTEKDGFRLVATQAIAAGSQIWNTYAEPPDSDLLRRYGHVDGTADRPNEHDVAEVTADSVLAAAIALDPALASTRDDRVEFALQHFDECVLLSSR